MEGSLDRAQCCVSFSVTIAITAAATDSGISPLPICKIAQRIRLTRGQRVLLDAHLVSFYGETTERFNQQVRRHLPRFLRNSCLN